MEINSIETSQIDEPNSSKLLDVWEDAYLLEYLKTGIHLQGSSQRQGLSQRIFDLLGIYLVFGLPLTEEGYHGFLIITEYITKFPWVVPITSKDAIEIARHIFHYNSIFGPVKGLLSDEGNEFFNLLVNTMLELFGIKHIITSTYHPQTNGLTEKFNGTLIKMLRTHAEENPTNWHLCLDLVVMAYRKRIHSSTGFAP